MSYIYADDALTLGSYKYYTYADYQADRSKALYSRPTPAGQSYTISRADTNGEPVIATRFAEHANAALRSYVAAQKDAQALNGKSFFVRSVSTNRVWKLTADVATTTNVQIRNGNTAN